MQVYVDGTAAVGRDAVHAVYSSFPWVGASTLGVFIGLSIGCPAGTTLDCVYFLYHAFAVFVVYVYQYGIWQRWLIIRSFIMVVDPEWSWLSHPIADH